MKKVPFIEQLEYTDCGICCTAMILKYYGHSESLASLKTGRKIGNSGLSMKDLNDILISRKMKVETSDRLDNFPCIAHINNSHFIVVEKVKENDVFYVDPTRGKVKQTKTKFSEMSSKYYLYPEPLEEFELTKENKVVENEIIKSILKQKKLLMFIVFFSLITSLVSILVSNQIGYYVDNYEHLVVLRAVAHMLFLVIIYFLIIIIEKKVYLNFIQKLNRDIQKQFIFKLLNKPYGYFTQVSFADVVSKPHYLQSIQNFLSNAILSSIVDTVMLVVLLVYVAKISLLISIIIIFHIIFYYLVTKYFNRDLWLNNQEEIVQYTEVNNYLYSKLQNIEKVKTSHSENLIYDEWLKKYRSFQGTEFKSITYYNYYEAFNTTYKKFFPFMIFIFEIIVSKYISISIGEMISVFTVSSFLFESAANLTMLEKKYFITKAYINRIYDLYENEVELTRKLKVPINNEIMFTNVSFKYTDKSPYIFEEYNLKVPEKKITAIMGESGKGKTTLINLLLGVYSEYDGEITIGGINIKNISSNYYSKEIRVLPQLTKLEGGTLREFFECSSEKESNEIKELLNDFGLSLFFENLPLGFDTPISSMGATFSGGQIQRMCLIKEITKPSKILILDESMNAIDYQNRKKILNKLKDLECTVIIVTHDNVVAEEAENLIELK